MRYAIITEQKFRDALYQTYGDDDLVEANLKSFGLDKVFDELQEKMQLAVGVSVELGLTGFLSRPNCCL